MIPATTPHAHTAITLRINIEAAYAKAGLIEVLRGGMPPKADEIVAGISGLWTKRSLASDRRIYAPI